MENDDLPYISVIITAYNRKEFLLNAIKSVLNQTLEKKYYEIIVIKNFIDKNIDDLINENLIKNILMEGTLGEFLYRGISEASGEIISFLDDDDLFFKNKLDFVYKQFKKDNNIVYYHNLCVPINGRGKTVSIHRMNSSLDFNMSSISIQKSIIKINKEVKMNISASPDTLMYLYALESNKKIIKGDEKLTYYMLHNSTSNIVPKNFEEYKKFIITTSNLYLDNFRLFKNLIYSKKAINYLNSRTTNTQIYKYIFELNEFPSKLINYIINSTESIKFRVVSFLACILIKVYPRFSKYFGKKMWDIYNKQAGKVI